MSCRRRLSRSAAICISWTVLLVLFRTDIVIASWSKIHETVRLKPRPSTTGFVRLEERCPGSAIVPLPTWSTAVVAGCTPSLDLMLALELFLRRKARRGREGIDELGELVAGFWEVVLDDARGLVTVEPSMSVIVKLPTLGQRSHAWKRTAE